jgi:hypothetical protein
MKKNTKRYWIPFKTITVHYTSIIMAKNKQTDHKIDNTQC